MLEEIQFDTLESLRAWLGHNHDSGNSIWLVKWKKASGKPYFSSEELVDELLCYGWVDSTPRKLDQERSMTLIAPRNPKSNWSGVNKSKVEKLTKAGRMKPSGLRLVELAKKSGTWNFLDDVESLTLPPDLVEEFTRQPRSAELFERFPKSSKRGILEWIKNAKSEATRKKRIIETAAKASQNIKANHPADRSAGPKL